MYASVVRIAYTSSCVLGSTGLKLACCWVEKLYRNHGSTSCDSSKHAQQTHRPPSAVRRDLDQLTGQCRCSIVCCGIRPYQAYRYEDVGASDQRCSQDRDDKVSVAGVEDSGSR